MNSNFIDFTLENIFSEVIPIADTLFDKFGVRILPLSKCEQGSDTNIICSYSLELSWLFEMVMKIYEDEINEHNRMSLLNLMVREANRIISIDFPKQALLIGVMNVARYWYFTHCPLKAEQSIEEYESIDYLYKIYK